MKNLVNYLNEIEDPRKERGIRHQQTTTLARALTLNQYLTFFFARH